MKEADWTTDKVDVRGVVDIHAAIPDAPGEDTPWWWLRPEGCEDCEIITQIRWLEDGPYCISYCTGCKKWGAIYQAVPVGDPAILEKFAACAQEMQRSWLPVADRAKAMAEQLTSIAESEVRP